MNKILDGAMGSELIQKGQVLPDYIWSADSNIKAPQLVLQIHKEYIRAGSNYITTNTFRTTPRAYMKTGLSESESLEMANKSLKMAVKMAKKAANRDCVVLGSIAPLEDCYQPELFPGEDIARKEFEQIGKWLKEEGVDIFLIETMNSIAEAQSCLDAVSNFNLPIWIGFTLKDQKRLLSEESLSDAISALSSYNVDCLLLNCNPLSRTEESMRIVSESWNGEWGVYPNLGIGEPSPNGFISNINSDEEFLDLIDKAINLGATILGGCCGSNTSHIKLISDKINE